MTDKTSELDKLMQELGFRYEPSEGGYYIHKFVNKPKTPTSLNSVLVPEVARIIQAHTTKEQLKQIETAQNEWGWDILSKMAGELNLAEFAKLRSVIAERNKLKEMSNMMPQDIDLTKINRLEVIDESGRAYVKGAIYGTPVSISIVLQDDGKTLKIFVEEK